MRLMEAGPTVVNIRVSPYTDNYHHIHSNISNMYNKGDDSLVT